MNIYTPGTWYPIEIAPKDGSEIMVHNGKHRFHVKWGTTSDTFTVCEWCILHSEDSEWGDLDTVETPLQWTPLPPIPK